MITTIIITMVISIRTNGKPTLRNLDFVMGSNRHLGRADHFPLYIQVILLFPCITKPLLPEYYALFKTE